MADSEMSPEFLEIVQAKNWSEILKQCNERLKRGMRHPFYLTMKAYALMKTKKYIECEVIITQGEWPMK
jgi:hypothetical protein